MEQIVLNGAIAAKADDAASYGYVQKIVSQFPCRSVIIQGGYHATNPEVAPSKEMPTGSNGSLVLIGSVEGALIQGNDCGGGQECHNFAVVTTGSEAAVWAARDVTLAQNTGWDYTGGSVRLIDDSLDEGHTACSGGLAAAAGAKTAAWSCEQAIGYTFTDTPALCGGSRSSVQHLECLFPPPANFVLADMRADMHMQKWQAVDGYVLPKVTLLPTLFNQRRVYRVVAAPSAAVDGNVHSVAAVVATLPLATTPSAAGKTVHFTVMVRAVVGTGAVISLMIDRGDTTASTRWLLSCGGGEGASIGNNSTEWTIRSFQTRLAWTGVAQFAIVAAPSGSGQQHTPPQIEVSSWMRVAQIGATEQ